MSSAEIRPVVGINERQFTKVHDIFVLLEEHLRPEERDETCAAYKLRWYRQIKTRVCSREDITLLRFFVDDMSERALKRTSVTETLFSSENMASVDSIVRKSGVLRARQLCESFCEELKDKL